jgi:Tol biopolymer transport system component
MKHFTLMLGAALAIPTALAQSVSVKDGSIQFTDKAGKTMALTSNGHDSNPVLAPDGKWVAFVRKIDGRKIATGSEEVDPSELWQIRADGKEPTLLVRCREAKGEKDHVIAAFENLQFSSNGKLLYS